MADEMRAVSTATRERLRQELEETRAAYQSMLEAIPAAAWEKRTANPAWNVRQTMFHITIALRFLPGDVALLRRGRSPGVPLWLFHRVNEWYTRWLGSRQTPASLAAEYDKRHEVVLALLESIKPEEWSLSGAYPEVNENLRGEQTVAEMFHYLTVHFEEHAADVRQAVGLIKGSLTTHASLKVSSANMEVLQMAQSNEPRKPPEGAERFFFRAPIYLYRMGLGWLMGERFLLLNHVGRTSGLPRQAVLEVVDHDEATDTYYVASGFGRKSQWFKNIQVNPEVVIQVGTRQLAVRAEVLDPEASGERMVAYARRHPVAAENLSRVLGVEVDGTEAGYRQAAEEHIPFVALRPQQVLREAPTAKELLVPGLLALGGLLILVRLLRRGD